MRHAHLHAHKVYGVFVLLLTGAFFAVDIQSWVSAIRLAKSSEEEAKQNDGKVFRIFIERHSQNYILRASSAEECQMWMEKIQNAIERQHEEITKALQNTCVKKVCGEFLWWQEIVVV